MCGCVVGERFPSEARTIGPPLFTAPPLAKCTVHSVCSGRARDYTVLGFNIMCMSEGWKLSSLRILISGRRIIYMVEPGGRRRACMHVYRVLGGPDPGGVGLSRGFGSPTTEARGRGRPECLGSAGPWVRQISELDCLERRNTHKKTLAREAHTSRQKKRDAQQSVLLYVIGPAAAAGKPSHTTVQRARQALRCIYLSTTQVVFGERFLYVLPADQDTQRTHAQTKKNENSSLSLMYEHTLSPEYFICARAHCTEKCVFFSR